MKLCDERLAIARRAEEVIGVPFRLHGRCPVRGLDCVGLVAHAIKPMIEHSNVPRHYRLRYDDVNTPLIFFAATEFARLKPDERFEIGDIILVSPAAQQLHFLIIADDGFIHAHSGLRKIVKTIHPILSPVKAAWRYIGA